MDILVVIPTYNERENVRPLIEGVLAELGTLVDVVIVDDASPDGTGEVADELARESDRVHVIHRAGKLGLGTAHTAGLLYGLAGGARLLVTMDADLSHDPRYLPELIAGMDHHDIMIGSRYIPGGGTENWGLSRRILSRVANAVARLILGLEARDSTAGYRCYARAVLEAVDPRTVRSEGYSYLEELLYLCQRRGFRIGETPIVFVDRRHGRSKISKKEIFKAVLTLLRLRFTGDRASR